MKTAIFTGAALIVLLPQWAQAQAVPDLQDAIIQEGQVAQAADKAARQPLPPIDPNAGAIDGEAGVYILKVNDIFKVSANAGIGYNQNPQRVLTNPGDSFYKDYGLSAAIVTRLAGRIDLSAAVGASGRDYVEDFGPSSRNVTASLSAGMPIGRGPVYVGVTAFTGKNYDQEMDNAIGFNGVAATLSAVFPIGDKLALRPGLGVTRQWSEVEENDNVSANASLDLYYRVSSKVTLALQAGIARKRFDNFYEDVTFVEREDEQESVALTAGWQVTPNLLLSAAISYEKQTSSFFLADFESRDAALTLNLRKSF